MNLWRLFGICFVRQLLTKQVTYQQKLQSFSFFVGALGGFITYFAANKFREYGKNYCFG